MFGYGASTLWQANAGTWRPSCAWRTCREPAKLAAWLALLALAAFLVAFYRRKLPTPLAPRGRGAALAVLLFVPAVFRLSVGLSACLISQGDRAYVFYDVERGILQPLLCGFFVTDVLRSRIPLIVGAPRAAPGRGFSGPTRTNADNGVPAHTLAYIARTFRVAALGPRPARCRNLRRELRVLAPVLSRKPLAYEAFYAWMAPKAPATSTRQARESRRSSISSGAYLIFRRRAAPAHGERGARARHCTARCTPCIARTRIRPSSAIPRATLLAAFAQAARFEGDPAHSVLLSLRSPARGGADPRPTLAKPSRKRTATASRPPRPRSPRRTVPLRIESFARPSHGASARRSARRALLLVINEIFTPTGGEPRGRDVPLYRAFTGLMAVRLPAGRQERRSSFTAVQLPARAVAQRGAALLAALRYCGSTPARARESALRPRSPLGCAR